jgi:hypothetical protein
LFDHYTETTRRYEMTKFWTRENTAHMTAADIAEALPSSWTFSFVDLPAAMNYYHPAVRQPKAQAAAAEEVNA